MHLKTEIQKFLDHKKWLYKEEKDVFLFGIEIDNFGFQCSFLGMEDEKILIFYSHYPTRIKKKNLKSMAWLITQLNANISVGNFDLDIETGDLRYKTSIDVEGADYIFPLIENLVNANLSIFMQHYLPIKERIFEFEKPKINL